MSLWGKHPLIVPRWILTGIYGGFIVLGAAAVIFGSPTLNLTTPDGYTPIWGAVVSVSGLGCVIGSLREQWESLERWSLVFLVSTVLVFLVSAIVLLFEGDHSFSRATFTILVTMITVLPGVRVAYLLRRTGIKP